MSDHTTPPRGRYSRPVSGRDTRMRAGAASPDHDLEVPTCHLCHERLAVHASGCPVVDPYGCNRKSIRRPEPVWLIEPDSQPDEHDR
jgi:hypothetical protein